jgi:hypothetical protein
LNKPLLTTTSAAGVNVKYTTAEANVKEKERQAFFFRNPRNTDKPYVRLESKRESKLNL